MTQRVNTKDPDYVSVHAAGVSTGKKRWQMHRDQKAKKKDPDHLSRTPQVLGALHCHACKSVNP